MAETNATAARHRANSIQAARRNIESGTPESSIRHKYEAVRSATSALAARVSVEAQMVQSCQEANPMNKIKMSRVMLAMEVQPVVNTFDALPGAAESQGVRDERWLVAKAKSGHEEALGELYERHQFRTYRMALRILRNQQDAEDAMQRAFQRALVNLGQFREDSTFSTWLTRIAINEALMCLRQRRTHEPLHGDNADAANDDGGIEIADSGPTPEQILCDRERRAKLRQAIAELPQSLRMVVLHRELQELSNAETAQRLGLTESAVKSRTLRARRRLRKYIERNEADANSLDSGESAPI